MERIRERLDQLGGAINALARSAAPGRTPPVSDYRQMSAAAPRSPADADIVVQFDRLHQEIATLRSAIGQFAHAGGNQDFAKDLRRIADGMAGLQSASPAPGSHLEDIASELHQMRQAFSTMFDERDALDPGVIARSIESSYAQIAARLETGFRQPQDAQLSQSRQITELSDHLTAVRDLVEQLPLRIPIAPLADRLDEIEAVLTQIDGRGDLSLSKNFRAIEHRLDEVTRALVAVAVSPGGSPDGLDRIEARLATLSKGFEEMAGNAGHYSGRDPQSAPLLDHVSAQMADLSTRIDMLRDMPSAAAMPDLQRFQSIEASLASLATRLSGEQQTAGQPLADGRLLALEQTLGSIASRLESVSSQGMDFAPIASRLESIEHQIAISRDMAMDAASMAAERAIQMAGQTGDRPQDVDPQILDQLTSELRNIEAQTREVADRNNGDFGTIRQMLETMGDRLHSIEADIREAASQPQAHAQDDSAGYRQETTRYADAGSLATAHAPDRFADPVGQFANAPSLDNHADGIALLQEHESHPQNDRREPEAEDVPLEPGSGVPDLAALVRNASQRRKATMDAGAETAPGANDFMAAARRAAQSAAAEPPPSYNPALARQAKAGGRIALPSFFQNKRKLLMASAAIILVAASVPVAMQLMAGEPQIVDMPAAAGQQSQVEPGTIPKKPDAPAALATGQSSAAQLNAGLPPTDAQAAGPAVTPVEQAPALPGPQSSAAGDTDTTAAQELPALPKEIDNVALRQAIAARDAQALFEVARRYTDGDGIERNLEVAAKWYEAAARSGLAPAQYRFANFLEKGHGVALDVEKSALWYQRAAEQGNALAMHNLAVIHTSGLLAGKPDMESAIGWFLKAADMGVKDSQVNLGIIYAKGLGIETDLPEAYKWLAVATRGGDSDAAAKRDTLASAMRPDQLAQARAAAELWKPVPLQPAANVAEIRPEWKSGSGESASAPEAPQVPGSGEATKTMIAKVQSILTDMGYDTGPADGRIGARTRDAVKAFQKKAGMPVDGQISTELLKKLANPAA